MRIERIEKQSLNSNKGFWVSFDKLTENFKRTPQLNSSWLVPYIKYQLKNGEPYILAAYDNKELVGCLPLQKVSKKATRFWSYRQYEFLGSGPTDFFNIPVKDNSTDILETLFGYFFQKTDWDILKLSLLPFSGYPSDFITNFFSDDNKYLVNVNSDNGYNFQCTLGLELSSFIEGEFKKKNKDLFKSERRLKNDGIDVEVKSIRTKIFKTFIQHVDLYASRRATLGQYNYYKDENYRNFLKEVCENYESSRSIVFSYLQDNEYNVLAIQLDFIKNNVRYHWNHAYNEDYKRYSPGKILLKELLFSDILSTEIKETNHMRGLSSYKSKFTNQTHHFKNYTITNKKSFRINSTKLISKLLKTIK
jgi:hypothetical protein